MIISEEEVKARLNSPMNLINQIRERSSSTSRSSAMSLFGVGKRTASTASPIIEAQIVQTNSKEFNPFKKNEQLTVATIEQTKPSSTPTITPSPQPANPSIDNLLDNSESQIKLGLAHDSALDVLNTALGTLKTKLDDIKPDKLSAVISAASKTVESIRRERNESAKLGKDKEVHYHFYTPIQKKVSDYEVIEITS